MQEGLSLPHRKQVGLALLAAINQTENTGRGGETSNMEVVGMLVGKIFGKNTQILILKAKKYPNCWPSTLKNTKIPVRLL